LQPVGFWGRTAASGDRSGGDERRANGNARAIPPPTLLEPTFAFTTQLRGATDLAAPFRATFPNVSGAPLGTEFMVLSFDPATGHLVQDGTATVVAAGGAPLQATGRAVGALAQQAPLEGELVITWTPSPFSALDACFHVLVPNVTSAGGAAARRAGPCP
jgi:hypothetical protein